MRPEFDALAELLPVTKQRHFAAPLLVGVISDTHVHPGSARRIPLDVFELFERFEVDLLIHAGDANCEDVHERLARIAPLIAVPGNNENGFLQRALSDQVEFTVGAHRVGVIHGHQGTSARQTAHATFSGRADIVIYGHSHIPKIEKIGDTIYFNPGSATDRRWNEHYGIGLIRFSESRIDPELILFTRSEHLSNIVP